MRVFLAREASLGRNDLVFPILYIRVPALGARCPVADPIAAHAACRSSSASVR
jgi:hypothetical protein